MTQHAKLVAFALIVILGGCQYEGTIDASNLLASGERIIISKEVIKPKLEQNYYASLDNAGLHVYGDFGEAIKFTTSKNQFDSQPTRLKVQGESGLFIEYNISSSDNSKYYIATGGIPTYFDYTPRLLPYGSYDYFGKVVAINSIAQNTDFSEGTVEANVNFDTKDVWIEFSGTGRPEIDRRFDNLTLDTEYGEIDDYQVFNRETGEYQTGYFTGQDVVHYNVFATLHGADSKAMVGFIRVKDGEAPPPDEFKTLVYTDTALFVAERNDMNLTNK